MKFMNKLERGRLTMRAAENPGKSRKKCGNEEPGETGNTDGWVDG